MQGITYQSMNYQEIFAQQSFEQPDAQHFDAGDIYLPDLTDLDDSAIAQEEIQVLPYICGVVLA